VKVRHDEGIENHIGPKPCADIREDISEASVVARRHCKPMLRKRKRAPECTTRRRTSSGGSSAAERLGCFFAALARADDAPTELAGSSREVP